MLGAWKVPGCCPRTRAGHEPGPDCSGGYPLGTRRARRQEARGVRAEVAGALSHPVHDPSVDPIDCIHGCCGSPYPCTTGRCTFTCHPEGLWGRSG